MSRLPDWLAIAAIIVVSAAMLGGSAWAWANLPSYSVAEPVVSARTEAVTGQLEGPFAHIALMTFLCHGGPLTPQQP